MHLPLSEILHIVKEIKLNCFNVEEFITELEELEEALDMHESLTAMQPLYQEGDEYV